MPMSSTGFGPIVEPRNYAEGGTVENGEIDSGGGYHQLIDILSKLNDHAPNHKDLMELALGFMPGAGLSSYLANPNDESVYGLLDKLGAAGDVAMLASPMAGPAFGLPLAGGAAMKGVSQLKRLGRFKKAITSPEGISGAAGAGYAANESIKGSQEQAAKRKSSDYRKGGLVYLAEGGDGGEGGGDHGDAGGGPGGEGGGLGSGDGGGTGAGGGDAGAAGGGDSSGGGPGDSGGAAGAGDAGGSAGDAGGLGIGSAGDAGQGLGLGDAAGLGEAGYGDPSGPEVGDPSSADPTGLTGLAAIAGLDDTGLDPSHVAAVQADMESQAFPDPDMYAAMAPEQEHYVTPAMAQLNMLSDLDPAVQLNIPATIADLLLSFTPIGLPNSVLAALGWADKALGLKTGIGTLGSMGADLLGIDSTTLATNRDMRNLRSGDVSGLGFGAGSFGAGPSSSAGEPSGSHDRFGDADPYAYGIAGNYLPNYGRAEYPQNRARGGLAALEAC